MQNEKITRFNRIITKALDSSVYSRQVHDTLYGENRFYTYGMEHKRHTYERGQYRVIRGAFIENHVRNGFQNTRARLVLSMELPDHFLVYATHHELAHIHQISNFVDAKLNQTATNITVNDYASMFMLQEAHAAVWEQEGPLCKFFDDLGQNKIDGVDDFKKHAQISPKPFLVYSASLFQDRDILKMPVSAAVDRVTFSYYNGFMNQPEEKRQKSFIAARKATVKTFLKSRNKDIYAENILNTYQERGKVTYNGLDISNLGLSQEEMDFLGARADMNYMGETPTLERLGQALNNGKDVFLPLADLQDAVGGKDNYEFIENIMTNPVCRETYRKLVRQNKVDGLL